MQLFYAPGINFHLESYTFPSEESAHMVRVVRLRVGDRLHITDGEGTLALAEITEASPKRCQVTLLEREKEFEKRPYSLDVAIAPTKNMERLEWFTEKATEMGIDRIIPLLSDRCERRIVKRDRLEKVVTSAMKQSLKAYLPIVDELTPFRSLITLPFEGERYIAHCEVSEQKVALEKVLTPRSRTLILIGPEGDFSPQEIALARSHGYREISLGSSRLRTETAGIAAVHTVMLMNH